MFGEGLHGGTNGCVIPPFYPARVNNPLSAALQAPGGHDNIDTTHPERYESCQTHPSMKPVGQSLVPCPPSSLCPSGPSPLPVLVREAGSPAGYVWDEFFAGQLRNPHTRSTVRIWAPTSGSPTWGAVREARTGRTH